MYTYKTNMIQTSFENPVDVILACLLQARNFEACFYKKSLMHAKIFEIRAKKAADWRSENLGKNLQNDLGSLPSRSTGFARPGCPVAVVGPKVGVLPSERTVPKGPKASRQKQNGVIMTRFLTNRFEVAKVSRIVVSGGFRCGACW